MPSAGLLTPLPAWATATAPEGDCVLLTQLTLVRNLADFPFPDRCSTDERLRVEERILAALESVNLLSRGEYFSVRELDAVAARVLSERRLAPLELLSAKAPRGIFVDKAQDLAVVINSTGHLCIRLLLPGMQLQEAWQRLSALDDALGSVLDFAWDEKLGFLTSELGLLGTGLKAGLLMHFPAAGLNSDLTDYRQTAATHRLALEGLRPGQPAESRPARRSSAAAGPPAEQVRDQSLYTDIEGAITSHGGVGAGDLYFLVNRGTLGESEEEILFHLRHTATELMTKERAAREALRESTALTLADRIGRAHGVARGAQLLGFAEALVLLSSLRLGALTGMLDMRPEKLGALLLSAQAGHLQMAHGQPLDGPQLTVERAALFRARFDGTNR